MHALRPLSSIASVSSGFHYRTRIADRPDGEWLVAQGREVRDDLTWDLARMPRVNPGPAERRARLKPGDILVLARGERPYAITVPDWSRPALAASSFHIVRVRRELVLPEYLACFLNSPDVLAGLSAAMRGKKIRFLPRAELAATDVALPPLARQADIAAAASLVEEETRLHAELTAERLGALGKLMLAADAAAEARSRADRIAVSEAQLDVVRDRLERGFGRVGLLPAKPFAMTSGAR